MNFYITTDSRISAHTLHIHNNKHEYGILGHTIHLLNTYSKGKKMNCWESFLHGSSTTTGLTDWWIVGQWTQSTILLGHHNETTRYITWYPPWLSTHQTSTLTTSTRGKSIIKYIQYVCNIISIYPYANFHIYCRLYMQPQIRTAYRRYYKVEQILLYH